jgi:hypothetical protein
MVIVVVAGGVGGGLGRCLRIRTVLSGRGREAWGLSITVQRTADGGVFIVLLS